MKKLLLLILGIFIALPSVARDFKYTYEGQTLTYTVISEEDKTVRTKAGSDYSSGNNIFGALIIPEEVSDGKNVFKVIEIGNWGFYNCSSVTSVTIPNSVTYIGHVAFNGCSSLTSVVIGNSVTKIGRDAFRGCSGLNKAEFASIESLCNINFEGVFSNPLTCAHHLYINGEEVTDLVIPESVTSIGYSAFNGCSSLTSVEIPNTVTTIGYQTFAECSSLTSVVIPNSVKTIDDSAFEGCSGLSGELIIPNSVTAIGVKAFRDCSSLISVAIGNSVETIGSSAFYGCRGLNKAEFASIESLCNINFESDFTNPLYYAHHLYINGEEVTDLVIPESVTSIGDYAFHGCYGLTSVEIPNSVETIGSCAFYYCDRLNKAEFASIESLCNINFENGFSNPLTCAQHLYINGEEVTDLVIPESVTSIGNHTFSNCRSLSGELIIPNSVTEIGISAFGGCSSLTSVVIPASVTEIAETAFLSCSSLTSVTIPASITEIGPHAFALCSSLTSVVIPASVTEIGSYVFSYCSSLTSVVIPNSVTSIGSCAFYDCSSLTSVVIPNSVTSIGRYAFGNCYGLTSVYYGADNPIQGKKDIFDETTYSKATLYMTEKGALMAGTIDPWKNFVNIKEHDFAGIDEIAVDNSDIDYSAPYEVFNLSGVKVSDSIDGLAPGLYVVRQGTTVDKIAIN